MERREWLESKQHLPHFMRDFHDQKQVFKRIDELVESRKAKNPKDSLANDYPNWIVAHVYIVDFFLWYMASCGYTLQKTHARVDGLFDLPEDLAAFRAKELDQLMQDMDSLKKEDANGARNGQMG